MTIAQKTRIARNAPCKGNNNSLCSTHICNGTYTSKDTCIDFYQLHSDSDIDADLCEDVARLIIEADDQPTPKETNNIQNNKKVNNLRNEKLSSASNTSDESYKLDIKKKQNTKKYHKRKSKKHEDENWHMFQRKFHRGHYIKTRYRTDSILKQQQINYDLPSGLRAPSRYGNEPRCRQNQSPNQGTRCWPTAPVYKTRERHKAIQCEFLKVFIVEQKASQATVTMKEQSTQLPKTTRDHLCQTHIKTCSIGTQTLIKTYSDTAIQNVRKTDNKMVETTVKRIQCGGIVIDETNSN